MKQKILVLLLVVLLGFSLYMEKHTSTPKSSIIIKPNKNYSIMLNGKAKTLRVTYTAIDAYDSISDYQILVNNSVAYAESFSNDTPMSIPDVKLLNLKNGQSYLWIAVDAQESDIVHTIVAYQESKFTEVIDGQCLPGCSFSQTRQLALHNNYDNVTVSGQTLSIAYHVMSRPLGDIAFVAQYAYKSGELKRTSAKMSGFKMTKEKSDGSWVASKCFKTKQEVQTYTVAGGAEEAFLVPSQKNVMIKGLSINNGMMFLKVAYGSKMGWLNVTHYKSDELFYNLAYAG